MSQEMWLRIDRGGFFPQETESETHFILSYQEICTQYPKSHATHLSWLVAAQKHFNNMFHAIPCWIEASLTERGLAPWERAACWQYPEGQSKIQVKKEVLELPVHEQKSILFHELIHASRARLNSSCFEELIAYEAMKTLQLFKRAKMRCWLSRLFVAPSDSLLFLLWHLILFVLMFVDVLPLGYYGGLIFAFWTMVVLRAIWIKNIWKKAFDNIEHAFKGRGWRFILRATDQDIAWLASLSKDSVCDKVMDRALHQWRWNYLVVCSLL